jgi:GH15 family glucan-1,4-alpha-glucosidase
MNSYSDGVDGAPIPWEIDETGLGAWTLYDHYRYLHGAAATTYLRRVYPAIARAADFLTLCRDPTTGLQCLANEDDNYTPSETLHGAGPVYLGLESAVAAAQALGDDSSRTHRWQARVAQLRSAIEALYDPARRSYRPGTSLGNAYNVDYGDGGWMLWPVHFRPYSSPQMAGEADAVAAAMRKSLAADRGQYEAKAVLGLAHAWAPLTPAHRRLLDGTLRYMARALTTPTGLFGESWIRLGDGHPIPVQDMPHVWEHTLFYLSALQVYGSRPYSFSSTSFHSQACASGSAPPSACP